MIVQLQFSTSFIMKPESSKKFEDKLNEKHQYSNFFHLQNVN